MNPSSHSSHILDNSPSILPSPSSSAGPGRPPDVTYNFLGVNVGVSLVIALLVLLVVVVISLGCAYCIFRKKRATVRMDDNYVTYEDTTVRPANASHHFLLP